MANVSLKVLEKSLNFLFKNGYEPCQLIFTVDLSLPQERPLKQGFDHCSPEYETSDRNLVHVLKADEP